jgi:SHS family lactate transporter-like MFS transporter
LPALLALFVRVKVKESEAWERSRTADWSQLWKAIFSHWKIFLYIAVLMSFMNMASHGTQDMYPTFLQRYFHFDASKRSMISAIGSTGAIFGGVLFGFLSDRMGRRRSIITALLLAVAMIPLWAFSPTTALIIAGAFAMQFMVQGAWGVIPAHLSELAPNSVRGFLPGFAYQCGVLVSGSIVYIQAFMAERMSYAATMAATGAVVFIGGAIVTALGKEHRGREF